MTDDLVRDDVNKKLHSLKTKILRPIPAYGHYRIEEALREWDRVVRDEIVGSLKEAERQIEKLFQHYATNRDTVRINSLDGSRKTIRSTRETIRTSAYGYWPSFSTLKVDDKALLHVLDIDEEILEKGDQLARNLLQKANTILSSKVADEEQRLFEEFTITVRDTSGNVDALLSERHSVLRKGTGKG